MAGPRRPVLCYVAALLVLLGVGCLLAYTLLDVPIDGTALASLLLLAFGFQRASRQGAHRSTNGSVQAVVIVAAIPLTGPVGAALVGALPALIVRLSSTRLHARLFNFAQAGLLGLSSGLVYLWCGGATATVSDAGVPYLLGRVLLPLVAASVFMLITNGVVLGGIIRLAEGIPVRSSALQIMREARLVFLGYGAVSFLFVVLWRVEGVGPLSVFLIAGPLLIAQWSVTDAAWEREARQRMARTLVAAVEVRGAQRRGQSERVAEVCAAVGEGMRLSTTRAEVLQFAAAVHNLGLIAPPDAAASGQELTLEQIREHPARGRAMVEGIDFLAESQDAIAHHHERWDGRGYPDGLVGEQIPLFARILAVADLYVALTWGPERMSPQKALAVAEERAGSHLDPTCVAALAGALKRGRIEHVPAPEGSELLVDHDAPEVADRIAALGR